MAGIFVEEFLYRGRSDAEIASGQMPAWHVTLAVMIDDGFGGTKLNHNGPLTMTQAQAAGYDLPAIITDINATLAKQCEALQAQIDPLNDQIASLSDQLATAQAKLAEAQKTAS